MKFARVLIIVLLIVAPAGVRAVHFERSLVPMGALALFCGARFRNRWLALGIPLASMVLGDVLIGVVRHNASVFTFHQLIPIVYGCYALNVLMGIGLRSYWDQLSSEHQRQGDPSATGLAGEGKGMSVLTTRVIPIAGATLGGAIFFYLVTNFADWYFFDTYAKSWKGLIDCYVAAIPFFRSGTLLADVCGSILLFGGDYLLQLQLAQHPETERV